MVAPGVPVFTYHPLQSIVPQIGSSDGIEEHEPAPSHVLHVPQSVPADLGEHVPKFPAMLHALQISVQAELQQ